MEKLTATCMLLAAILFLSVSAKGSFSSDNECQTAVYTEQESPQPVATEDTQSESITEVKRDTVPKNKKNYKTKQTIVKTENDKTVEMTIEDGVLKGLKLDGETIPEEEFGKYEDVTKKLRNDFREAPMPPAPPAAPPAPPAPNASDAPPPPPPPPAPNFWTHHRAVKPHLHHDKKETTTTIITEKDEDGNTIIRIESDGSNEPMEIRLNGETESIFIDGNELEEGDTALIIEEGSHSYMPKIMYGENAFSGNNIHIDDYKGDFKFDSDDMAFYFDNEGLNDQIKEQLKHYNDAYKKYNNHYSKYYGYLQPQKLRKHYRDSQRKLNRKERDELRKMKSEAREKLQKTRKERRKNRNSSSNIEDLSNSYIDLALSESYLEKLNGQLAEVSPESILVLPDNNISIADTYSNWNGIAINSLYGTDLEREMIRDGLITDTKHYTLELSKKRMKVNGKKQPEEIHQKYVKMYQRKHRLNTTDNDFKIEIKK